MWRSCCSGPTILVAATGSYQYIYVMGKSGKPWAIGRGTVGWLALDRTAARTMPSRGEQGALVPGQIDMRMKH